MLNSGTTAQFVESDNYPSPNMMHMEEMRQYELPPEEVKESQNDFIYMNRPDLDGPLARPPLPTSATPQHYQRQSEIYFDPV